MLRKTERTYSDLIWKPRRSRRLRLSSARYLIGFFSGLWESEPELIYNDLGLYGGELTRTNKFFAKSSYERMKTLERQTHHD